MRVLVLGSGGREHAICHTLHLQGNTVYCFPGNAGTEQICEPVPADLDLCNFKEIASFAKEQKIDLTVAGPENLLAEGIADLFSAEGLALFGPNKKAATLESSKALAKQFMEKYGIPTARFKICSSIESAEECLLDHFDQWEGAVIKPSGLTNGKGVAVCKTKREALSAVREIMQEKKYGSAGSEIVIEEILAGKELSLLAFCDGKSLVPMIPSQDHKRLNDQEEGPNTGGMGAYAPVNFLDGPANQAIQTLIVDRTLHGLKQEGLDYRGVIYFGIMLTADGPKVLEYNCRFGDPETQAILPLLESDLASIMLACAKGALKNSSLLWKPQAACCVVLASKGYPESYKTGEQIFHLDALKEKRDLCIFHAGTRKDGMGNIVTSGGRVLGITGMGNTLEDAVSAVYNAIDGVNLFNSHYRKDIAYQAKVGEEK